MVCLLNESVRPSLPHLPRSLPIWASAGAAGKLRVDDDWRKIDESSHVAYFITRDPYLRKADLWIVDAA